MSEKDLNIEYICEKTLLNKDDELVPIILSLIQESYKAGLCQTEFDNTMNLIEENQELKKQLEEINKFKFSYRKDETKIPPIIRRQKDVEIIKNLENQQKEFIGYLEDEININPYDISDYDYEDIINTILSKYKEIIGDDK